MLEVNLPIRVALHLQARRTRLAWRLVVARLVELVAKKELRLCRFGLLRLQNHGWRRYYLRQGEVSEEGRGDWTLISLRPPPPPPAFSTPIRQLLGFQWRLQELVHTSEEGRRLSAHIRVFYQAVARLRSLNWAWRTALWRFGAPRNSLERLAHESWFSRYSHCTGPAQLGDAAPDSLAGQAADSAFQDPVESAERTWWRGILTGVFPSCVGCEFAQDLEDFALALL